jgi:hypothetical protein
VTAKVNAGLIGTRLLHIHADRLEVSHNGFLFVLPAAK